MKSFKSFLKEATKAHGKMADQSRELTELLKKKNKLKKAQRKKVVLDLQTLVKIADALRVVDMEDIFREPPPMIGKIPRQYKKFDKTRSSI